MRILPFLLCALCVFCGFAASAKAKPNFVLIFADDLGYGDVGYQGGDVPTPHIDSIARGGIKFTDGYVTCPVCAPSRAGLLTGRYQQSFGFWDNIGPFRASPEVQPGIPVDLPILSERLKTLGYTCGLFGKTHDGDAEAQMAFSRWDEFYGFNNGASNFLGDMNRPHNPIFHNKMIVSRPYGDRGIDHKEVNHGGVLVKDLANHLTGQLGDMAVKFIEDNKARPFLCYLPFNAIHGPFQAPKPLVDKYAHIPDEKRRIVMAMLDSMDQNVGKVLDTLKRNGLEENTLVVFLSDNGGHEASPNTPLRGKKGTSWEGGLRVPFCMSWKGTLPAGQTVRHPVISLDILPTFVAAAGARIDPAWQLDGVNLLPFLTGKRKGRPHQSLFWTWGPRKAIRQGDLKAVTQDDGQSWQLFDLATDREETTDLAAKRHGRLQTLRARHKEWESGLMPQQFGWNKDLGHEDPEFGKPKPYHDPDYFAKQTVSLSESVAALAQREIDEGRTVGLSIGVAKGDEILLLEGYGQANLELSVPATANHVYRIGSITKMFTAVAILLLAEDGALGLDDPLPKFLPGYPAPAKNVTVRHLLNHTSGIVSFTDLPDHRAGMRRDMTPDEILARFKDKPLLFPPGDRFRYCNSGYYLLGMIVEEASGKKYEEFLRERILDPLGLDATVYDRHARIIPNRASGYAMWGKPANAPFLSMTQPFAAGALASTSGDLLKFQRALATGKLLKPESRKAMVTRGKLNNGRGAPYGFGCFVGKSGGRTVIRHGGGIPGFVTELSCFPEDDLTVVVLANANLVKPQALAAKIAGMVLDQKAE